MSRKVNKTNRLPLYTLLATGIILCIIVATMTYKNMYVQEETKKLSYIPKAGANTLVYYQSNEFYNDKAYYTPADKLPFLGSIIDKVSIGFNYELHYSDAVSGSYTAKITKTLVAYAPGSTEPLYSTEPEVEDETNESYDLFTDMNKVEKEKKLRDSILKIQEKYGKNSLLKGLDFMDNATQRERNEMIGGHRGAKRTSKDVIRESS